ncbi:MAG: hypothetical protein H7315_17830 [Herminiimonas sp.]|nr:hypothetical protein [Herminiimonas sp.]
MHAARNGRGNRLIGVPESARRLVRQSRTAHKSKLFQSFRALHAATLARCALVYNGIRDGATLIQSADDVIEVLSDFHGAPHLRLREIFAAAPDLDDAVEDGLVEIGQLDIAALLTTAPVAVDDLIRLSSGSPGAVQMALLELELAGRLTRHAGGRVSLDTGG